MDFLVRESTRSLLRDIAADLFIRRTFEILLRNVAPDVEEAVRGALLVVTPQVFLIGQLFGREDDDRIARLIQRQGGGSDARNAFLDDTIGQACENSA